MRSVIVLLLTLGVAASAQHAPERTPGRVGGSTNNPQVHRPAPTTGPAVKAAAIPVDPGQQQEFQDVRAVVPDLTPQVYRQLRFISDQVKALGKQVETVELAKLVAKRHGDAVGALRHDVKLSGHDAKKIYSEALLLQ
jgi:hypothetical protein